jgi:hypothetical protein
MRATQLRRVLAEAAAAVRATRLGTPHPAKVTAIWCRSCRRWLKPAKFSRSSTSCLTCLAMQAAQARRAWKASR